MPFNLNGFLGREIEAYKKQNYEQNKELFVFCEEFNRYAYKIRDNIEVQQQDIRGIGLSIMFVNIQNTIQGSIILCKYGLNNEAKAITRTALEMLFYLRAIYNDAEFYNQLLLEDEINRRNILNRIKNNPDNFDKILQDLPYFEALEGLKEKTKGQQKAKIKDVAEKAGLLSEYLNAYTTLSDSIHTNIRSISDKCITSKDNKSIEALDAGLPSAKDIELVLFTNCDIILITLDCISHYFNLNIDNDLETFANEIIKVFKVNEKKNALESLLNT